MTAGSITPNLFDRLALAFGRATKAAVQPGKLYPPGQTATGAFPISWPGWEEWEQRYGPANRIDAERVKRAMQSPWVFADVRAIANEFSVIELQVKRREGEDLIEEKNHDLERLWEAPNPHMGRSFVASFWAESYVYSGKAYLFWVMQGGRPVEIWPVPPFMITPIPDERDVVKGYAFRLRPDADPILIPPALITFSHSVNLLDVRDGLSFLVAAGVAIESDLAMAKWNHAFFGQENATPEGLITVPRDTLDLDMARIRQEIWDFFANGQRRVAVARAGDMDWKPFGRSQREMEFKEGRDFNSREIGRTLGFPDGYWSETANRANAEQARATMISGAVWPLAVRLGEDLNTQQVRRWYGPEFRVGFKDIRPVDRELLLKETAARKDYWTIDELREADGKEPIGDYRGLLLLEELKKAMPLPGTPASEEAEAAVAAMEAAAEPVEEEVTPADTDAGLPPAEESPLDAETPPMEEGGTIPEEVKRADLARWERKALKALRTRGRAGVGFESDAIGAEEAERISEALRGAQTAEEVRAAFKAAGDEPDIDGVWDEAVKWARLAMREGE